jgi:hypothetical protein
MNALRVGLSVRSDTPPELFELVDFLEVKKVSSSEAVAIQEASGKPLLFHLQYLPGGSYVLATSFPLDQIRDSLEAVWDAIRPRHVSLHFGPATTRIRLEDDAYLIVGLDPPLSRGAILQRLEHNLRFLKSICPGSLVLIENIEFVPEFLSRGGYRYISEAEFFSQSVITWKNAGILDGIIFDIAHGLIASGNHPLYNGLAQRNRTWTDAVRTDEAYGAALNDLRSEDLLHAYRAYIDKMPLDLVREIHLSGIHRTEEGVWLDAHEEVGELELEALHILLHHPTLRKDGDTAVTLEYNRKPDRIRPQIEKIRNFLCTQ